MSSPTSSSSVRLQVVVPAPRAVLLLLRLMHRPLEPVHLRLYPIHLDRLHPIPRLGPLAASLGLPRVPVRVLLSRPLLLRDVPLPIQLLRDMAIPARVLVRAVQSRGLQGEQLRRELVRGLLLFRGPGEFFGELGAERCATAFFAFRLGRVVVVVVVLVTAVETVEDVRDVELCEFGRRFRHRHEHSEWV